MKLLSAIVPCYNEEENVRDFYDEFIKNQPFFEEKDLDFELIYVDDGSRDHTVAEVKKLIEKKTAGYICCPFPAILARKRQFMQALKSVEAIMPYSWMPICRIRPLFFRKCFPISSRDMIRLQREELPERANRRSGRSLPDAFIN